MVWVHPHHNRPPRSNGTCQSKTHRKLLSRRSNRYPGDCQMLPNANMKVLRPIPRNVLCDSYPGIECGQLLRVSAPSPSAGFGRQLTQELVRLGVRTVERDRVHGDWVQQVNLGEDGRGRLGIQNRIERVSRSRASSDCIESRAWSWEIRKRSIFKLLSSSSDGISINRKSRPGHTAPGQGRCAVWGHTVFSSSACWSRHPDFGSAFIAQNDD